MKTRFKLLLLVLASFALVACGSETTGQTTKESTPSSSEVVKQTITLTLETPDGKTEETLSFKKGDTVLDILKAHHEVEETDGFITAIDGIAQDESKGLYWMFDINGTMAPQAASQMELMANDTIRFYQEVFKP